MNDNEFLLFDRIQKIQSVINKYGEENFALSFSGGKDSTVLSALLDIALPNNKIPRVYANTGIELNMIRDFVMELQKTDDRIVIIKPSKNIKQMLEEEGYPFKSKNHARNLNRYQRIGKVKSIQVYLGEHPDISWGPKRTCPKALKYQFTEDFNLKISDHCCLELKEKPLQKWQKENHRPYAIIGVMKAEGGRREKAVCLAYQNNKLKLFQPLVPVTKDWEDWFIEKYNIKICDIYAPPYNFDRTGCKGCPFARYLGHELETLEKFFPNERRQCEYIWKPVYEEYRRLGYRLKKEDIDECEGQMSIYDYPECL